MHPEELQLVVDRIIEHAHDDEQVEAIAGWAQETEARAFDGQLEHFVAAETLGIGIRVIKNNQQGISWVGVLDDDAIAECLEQARDNATFATPDPHAGLAEPDGIVPQTLQQFDERIFAMTPESKIELAIELERQIAAGDPRMIGVESADYSDAVMATALASTTGIRVAEAETSAYLGAYAMAADGDDMTTGFGFSVARTPQDLIIDDASSEAIERCIRLIGAGKVPSERVTAILDPYVTSQFIGIVVEMLAGDAVVRGRSPFGERRGQLIGSPLLTLLDRATDSSALTSAATDGEGLACRDVPLITNGVLNGFLHNSYSARVAGEQSTGSAFRSSPRSTPGVGPHVATILPGTTGPAEIVEQIGNGIVVQEMSGLHSGVNPISGDLSVGVEGARIRNGEIAEGIKEVTIASTVQRMLNDIVAIGSDLTYFPWESTGVTLAISDISLSGQ